MLMQSYFVVGTGRNSAFRFVARGLAAHRPVFRRIAAMAEVPKLLVITSPDTQELNVLEKLKDRVKIVGVGRNEAELADQPEWSNCDVLLNCGVGQFAGKKEDIRALWPKLENVKWLHSCSAGVEKLLFPELVTSAVPVSNARGVYSHSLAEYALTCCNWFAKDLPRMRRSQKEGKWDPYDVEELRGKTMGIIGYGDIGKACGRLARAFQMRVVAFRRRPEMSEADRAEGVLSRAYGPGEYTDMVAACDYIVMATPATPDTHKLFSAAAVAAMRPHAVFVNVGRGTCVDEAALTAALQAGKIRGAGLDVFYEEPLPADSPLYQLDNVLMSAHCADRTKEFQVESMEFFVHNMENYIAGRPLENIIDKNAGY